MTRFRVAPFGINCMYKYHSRIIRDLKQQVLHAMLPAHYLITHYLIINLALFQIINSGEIVNNGEGKL